MSYQIHDDHSLLCRAGLRAGVASKLLDTLGAPGLAGVTETELLAAGCPEKLAGQIVAAMVLGRRATRAEEGPRIVGTPEDVHAVLAERCIGLQQEVFWVLGLNVRNGLIDVAEVARGSAYSVEIHPREAFRPAIRMSAAAIVMAHNHPSGDPTPSEPDVTLTARMMAVGELLGIPVIDHVVITPTRFRSIGGRP